MSRATHAAAREEKRREEEKNVINNNRTETTLRAWLTIPRGWTLPDGCGISAATTRSKARYRSWIGARDAGFSLRLTDFRVLRLPELDEWARTSEMAARGHSGYVPEYVPGGLAAARRALG